MGGSSDEGKPLRKMENEITFKLEGMEEEGRRGEQHYDDED